MVCGAGLDSVSLRSEVCRLAKAVITFDACTLFTADPETALFTHGWVQGLPDSLARVLITELHEQEIADHLELARSGAITSSRNADAVMVALRAEGFEDRARTALALNDDVWGAWNLYRQAKHPFSEKELGFLRVAAPHVARGLRAAAGLEPTKARKDTTHGHSPGVIALDGSREILLSTGPAAVHLEDLSTVGVAGDLLPCAVMSVVAQLGATVGGSASAASTSLRAQGASGERYTLHAHLAERDCIGECAAVVVIEPTSGSGDAGCPWLLNGLTPRERQVVRLVLEGRSTKQVAARLRLSAYTVQDHLTHACEKVGVRGRHALLARLYGRG
jgi:DNA-binding CsgD family transcriptional regulator